MEILSSKELETKLRNGTKVPLDPAGIRRIAQRMLADYDAHRPNETFANHEPNWLTLNDAYAIQRTVAELRTGRGERCLGFKVGCISSTIRKQLKLLEPVRGYLWQSEVLDSGSHISYDSRESGRASRFVNLAIEGEIALRLGCDISVEVLHDVSIPDCVQTWCPVIELHNAVFRGPIPTSQELVAGNAMHAGFVARPAEGKVPLTILDQAQIRVEIDGKEIETKNLTELPGGPLGSLRWLAHSLSSAKKSLKAGDLVLTGSPGRLIPVGGSRHIVVSCEGQQVELFVDGDANGKTYKMRGRV